LSRCRGDRLRSDAHGIHRCLEAPAVDEAEL
jgi:hypothetical protein